MSKASLSPEALASKAGISSYQLDNLLYCRALNISTLDKNTTRFVIDKIANFVYSNYKSKTLPLPL
jgi:hypothetical protein